MNSHYDTIGFTEIIQRLTQHAVSEKAKAKLSELEPYLNEDVCRRKMHETTLARKMIDEIGLPPLSTVDKAEEYLCLAQAGSMLLPEQLFCIAQFASACARMSAYLKKGEKIAWEISSYGRSISELALLRTEIISSVDEVRVFDEADSELKNVRRKMEHVSAQIKEKLTHILQSRKSLLAESYITMRGNHYVLPVKRQFQSQFGGTVIEISAKGNTVFMEPGAVSSLSEELSSLSIEEDNCVRRVLYTLSASVCDNAREIRNNIDLLEELDVIFAKGKFSAALNARDVKLGTKRGIKIVSGRHPLLDPEKCVPLDFETGEETAGVIITGPNTGGKTVAIKTVGLLCAMAQSGLNIPCGENSYIAMHDKYLCDIGDSQNIASNLSTFSGHITNIIDILSNATSESLVILDELGSGTDPAEGMGLAIAVLEELENIGSSYLVTTHYPEVKEYAKKKENVICAAMAFDRESLKPCYRLELGVSGESCALYIAQRLGLGDGIIKRAEQIVYGHGTDANEELSHKRTSARKRGLLIPTEEAKKTKDLSGLFSVGDSVYIMPEKQIGIIYRPADKMGDVTVFVKGEKKRVKYNRVKLNIPASELYPPDYDFSIIFDSVENRKARHIIGKRYDENAVITYEDGNDLS